MENNIPVVVAKKVWSIVRFILYMVRKGICKKDLLLDPNLLMKRGKIAGKALRNLMFHHHRNNHLIPINNHQKEYEFSCSNTPFHAHFIRSFHFHKRSKKQKNKNNVEDYIGDVSSDLEGVSRVLEMMLNGNYDEKDDGVQTLPSPSPSPFFGLSFGKSPMVRQLKITDSPYPALQNTTGLDGPVDEAADAFIKRFYSQLKRQVSNNGGSSFK